MLCVAKAHVLLTAVQQNDDSEKWGWAKSEVPPQGMLHSLAYLRAAMSLQRARLLVRYIFRSPDETSKQGIYGTSYFTGGDTQHVSLPTLKQIPHQLS